MSTPVYETVAPLVSDVQTHGRSVTVTFTCPRSGERVTGRHTAPASTGGLVASRVGDSVKRSLLWSLRSTLYSVIRSFFGYNLVGRVASDLANTAMNEATRSASSRRADLSEDELHAAIVEAFQAVRGRFVWDPEARAWISGRAAAELMGPFQRQLAEHPVTHPYDRQVLARMLVEVARADGTVASEEQSWLTDLLAADQAGLAELTRRPPLTAAELGQTTAGDVRLSLLLSAWALALVDEHFDTREQQLLQAWGAGLDLRPAQVARARDASQAFVLDQALERMHQWGGLDQHARDQLHALAARLGMTPAQADQAEAAFQRRKAT